MHYVNGQIDKVKGRVIYERRKRRQAKLALPFSASASGETLADLEDSDRTPLVVNRGHDSMDHAAVEAGHHRTRRPSHTAQHYPHHPSQAPFPTLAETSVRYDDPYDGRGVDILTSQKARRQPGGASTLILW